MLGAAAALSLAGALGGAWAPVALGLALDTLVAVAWIGFFPSAVLVWRRHVEMAWGVRAQAATREGPSEAGALAAGRTFALRITLRNRGPVRLGRVRVRVVASSAIELGDAPLACALGPHSEVTLDGEGRARAAGLQFLHGAALTVTDRLGLASIEAYFPSPLPLRVFPRSLPRGATPPVRGAGGGDERVGPHALRVRGLGGELRELREHVPGDPFKQIAWKASARTGRLMVRELDRDTPVTHYLLLDLAGTMREGEPGRTRLDRAVELGCAWARAALEAGDRVGLVTYERRVHAHLAPGGGPVARARIVERLMEALAPIDEELTDLTDGELVAAVARYLRHQEGVDVRVAGAPAIDDPAWGHIATGPRGELYDLARLAGAIAPTVAGGGEGEMERVRAFCRARGIELPPRRTSEAGARARGLAAAVELAARGRGTQRLVLISDLEELGDDLGAVARALGMGRRRGHRVVCLAPSVPPPGFEGEAAEILGWEQRRREQAARRRVESLGVAVLPAGPADTLADLLARLGGRRRRA